MRLTSLTKHECTLFLLEVPAPLDRRLAQNLPCERASSFHDKLNVCTTTSDPLYNVDLADYRDAPIREPLGPRSPRRGASVVSQPRLCGGQIQFPRLRPPDPARPVRVVVEVPGVRTSRLTVESDDGYHAYAGLYRSTMLMVIIPRAVVSGNKNPT